MSVTEGGISSRKDVIVIILKQSDSLYVEHVGALDPSAAPGGVELGRICAMGFGMMEDSEEAGFIVWTLYLSCLVFIAYMFLLSLGDEAMLGVGLCLPGRDLVRITGIDIQG